MTPLHCSAQNGHVDVLKFLINKGADKDSKNCNVVINVFKKLHYIWHPKITI